MISSCCLNTVLNRSGRNICRLSTKNRNFSSLLTTAVENLSQSSDHIDRDNKTNQKRTMSTKTLTLDSMNPNVIKMEYAVRGPLVIRAGEIEKEIKQVRKLKKTKISFILLHCCLQNI